jgi:hypothetical protein
VAVKVPRAPEGRLTLRYSFTVRFIFANTLVCWIFATRQDDIAPEIPSKDEQAEEDLWVTS